jgi:hypothetical protein
MTTYSESDKQAIFRTLRKNALESPINFLQWVRTKDEHDADNPVKPFPLKDYTAHILSEFLKEDIVFLPKSRQIMITWLCCAHILWQAKSTPHRLLFIQSKKEEDAANLVFNGGRSGNDWNNARISFIESNLPWWLQEEKGTLDSSYGKLMFGNGSKIWGIPQGGDMIRSYTPSLVISDEAAFQPEFGGAYLAILPAIKHGGKMIAVSSANQGFFADIVKGRPKHFDTPIKGIKSSKTTDEVKIVFTHYTSDPDKDPATAKGKEWLKKALIGYKRGMKDPKWRKEMEIDFDAYMGQLIFPYLEVEGMDKIFVRPFEIEGLNLIAGLDYGTRNPSAFEVLGVDYDADVRSVWEYYEHPKEIDESEEDFRARKGVRVLAREIKACPYFSQINAIYADPSMWTKNQETKEGLKSIADLFAQEKIYLTKGTRGGDFACYERLNSFYWKDLNDPRYKIFQNCEWLWWEITKLRFGEHAPKTQDVKNLKEEIVDKDNHAWDSVKYALMSLPFPLERPKPRESEYSRRIVELEKGPEHTYEYFALAEQFITIRAMGQGGVQPGGMEYVDEGEPPQDLKETI